MFRAKIKKSGRPAKIWFRARTRKAGATASRKRPSGWDRTQNLAAPTKTGKAGKWLAEPRRAPRESRREFLPREHGRSPQRLQRENPGTRRPATECSGQPTPTATIRGSMPKAPPAPTGGHSPAEPRRRPRESGRGNPAPATPEALSVAPAQECDHVRERHGSASRSRSHSDHSRLRLGRGYPELRRHAAPGRLQRHRPMNYSGGSSRASPWLLCRFSPPHEGRPATPVSRYRVRSTYLSCNRRISGPAVAVVTTVREDDHQPRAYLVHESCKSAMLLEIPFDDEPAPETGKEGSRCTSEHRARRVSSFHRHREAETPPVGGSRRSHPTTSPWP